MELPHTLVGGGLKTLQESGRPMKSVLPKNIKHYKNKVIKFEPENNKVHLDNKESIQYDYLVVAIGIQLQFEKVKGLLEALKNNPEVCTNYSPLYVEKTFKALQNLDKGNAVFTFPNSICKCPGAPQKILYLADDYLRKNGTRKDTNLIYNTSLPVIFGVKKYADSLWEIVKKRDIQVNTRQNLIEIIPDKKIAVFQNLDKPDELNKTEYELLHVTPPMGPHDVLKTNTELSDGSGLLSVKKDTLQHTKFDNIFGLGDCTNSPNSKTAAAAASQSQVVYQNLTDVMNKKKPVWNYDGYASCPLIVSSNTCILAEFDYNLQPLETFPVDQSKERRSMFHLKKDFMPILYWNFMLKGHWNGPKTMRRLLSFGRN